MARLMMNNEVNPHWVEYVLKTGMTPKMFEMGASMRHRGGARPDMEAIELRVRKALEDDE